MDRFEAKNTAFAAGPRLIEIYARQLRENIDLDGYLTQGNPIVNGENLRLELWASPSHGSQRGYGPLGVLLGTADKNIEVFRFADIAVIDDSPAADYHKLDFMLI